MSQTHYTISSYIESKSTLLQKIKAIDLLIEKLELKLLEFIDGSASITEEYRMHDGQMEVRTKYKTHSDIEMGISSLERQRQRYINRLHGRSVLLRDVRGLKH